MSGEWIVGPPRFGPRRACSSRFAVRATKSFTPASVVGPEAVRSSRDDTAIHDPAEAPRGDPVARPDEPRYVPILREIVRRKFTPGTQRIEFTKQDVEEVADDLGLKLGNAADVIYRLRSRTRLPDDILDLGFTILRGVGRGQYALEIGGEAPVHLPEHDVYDHNDQTPLRECARVQSVSDDFRWPHEQARLQQYRQVGNAVPPLLARAVGEHVAAFMGWKLDDSRSAVEGPPEYRRLTVAERLARRERFMRGGASGAQRTNGVRLQPSLFPS